MLITTRYWLKYTSQYQKQQQNKRLTALFVVFILSLLILLTYCQSII